MSVRVHARKWCYACGSTTVHFEEPFGMVCADCEALREAEQRFERNAFKGDY